MFSLLTHRRMSICEHPIAHLNSFALTFSARSCLADKVQPPRPWQKSPVYCHIAENKEQGSKPVVISDFLDSSHSARVAQLVHFNLTVLIFPAGFQAHVCLTEKIIFSPSGQKCLLLWFVFWLRLPEQISFVNKRCCTHRGRLSSVVMAAL